uniref:Uncharacterized protein n=1 Tax=Utricularia reniformis TaxID=192314 RepID=A0A1Y0AYU9_9LAMI|nr:hypothetical protein AEK19_MT1037 [Utricularia reniformis]ART30342.1 hypothetical protein AEK19_MT1037 [Utricularia reniformis]
MLECDLTVSGLSKESKLFFYSSEERLSHCSILRPSVSDETIPFLYLSFNVSFLPSRISYGTREIIDNGGSRDLLPSQPSLGELKKLLQNPLLLNPGRRTPGSGSSY